MPCTLLQVTAPSPNHGRLVSLDALRGLAALSVVAYHYLSRYDELYAEGDRGRLPGWPYGYYGVHLFFIISGFVIFMTVDRSKRIRDFALSRFLRLYPLYWGCVVLTWTITQLFGPEDRATGVGTMLVNLTMFQSWVGVDYVDGVYWTLTAEMTFYILVAIGMATGCLAGRRLILSLAGWMLISLALRSGQAAVIPGHEYLQVHLGATYSHLFVAGICFYIGRRDGHNLWTVTGLGAALAIAFVGGGVREGLIVGGLFVLFAAALGGWLLPLAWRPLQALGLVSYALYLIHQNIGYAALYWLEERMGLAAYVSVPLAAAGAVALAALLTYGWDRPARAKLRSRARQLRYYQTS